jgi:hypothetical protein
MLVMGGVGGEGGGRQGRSLRRGWRAKLIVARWVKRGGIKDVAVNEGWGDSPMF